jgi:hypothetical protein
MKAMTHSHSRVLISRCMNVSDSTWVHQETYNNGHCTSTSVVIHALGLDVIRIGWCRYICSGLNGVMEVGPVAIVIDNIGLRMGSIGAHMTV